MFAIINNIIYNSNDKIVTYRYAHLEFLEVVNKMSEERLSSHVKPGIFHRENYRPVFEDYKFKKNIDGELCIAPKENTELKYYNPFAHYPDILKDFLEIGNIISRRITDINELNYRYLEFKNDVLSFVSKYGLLGELNKKRKNMIVDESGKMNIVTDEGKRLKLLPYEKFIRPFICLEEDTVKESTLLPHKPFINPKTGELAIKEEAEIKYIGEPVKNLIRHIVDYYKCLERLQKFKRDRINPDEVYFEEEGHQLLWKEAIEISTLVSDINIKIAYEQGNWQFEFMTDFLPDSILIMAMEEKVYEKQPLIFCKNCGRIIIQRHPNQRYCGLDEGDQKYLCGNASRQKRQRERKKLVKKLLKEGNDSHEIASVTGAKIDSIERWKKEL